LSSSRFSERKSSAMTQRAQLLCELPPATLLFQNIGRRLKWT
jgi:hypothetical protein